MSLLRLLTQGELDAYANDACDHERHRHHDVTTRGDCDHCGSDHGGGRKLILMAMGTLMIGKVRRVTMVRMSSR